MALVVGGATGAVLGGAAGAVAAEKIVSKPTAIGIAVGGLAGIALIVLTGGLATPAVGAGLAAAGSAAATATVTLSVTVGLTAAEGAEIGCTNFDLELAKQMQQEYEGTETLGAINQWVSTCLE